MFAGIKKWLGYNLSFVSAFINKRTGEKAYFYECPSDEVYTVGYYLRLPAISKHKPVTRQTDMNATNAGGSMYTKPYWHSQRIIEHMVESGFELQKK